MSTKEKLGTARDILFDLATSIEDDAKDAAWCRRQIEMHAEATQHVKHARILDDVSMLGGAEIEGEIAVWLQSKVIKTNRDAEAIAETLRAELAEARRLLATYAVTVVGEFGGTPVVEVKVAEEQGPWVVHDSYRDAGTRWCGEMDESGNDWRRNLADVTPFKTRAEATEFVRGFDRIRASLSVMTLAEARAIESAHHGLVDPMDAFISNTVEAVALTQGAPFDEALPAAESPDCPRGGCATVGFHAVDECTPKWVVVDNEGRPMFLRGDRETAHMWTRKLDEAQTFTEEAARAQVKPGARHERAVTIETARRIVADYARRGQPVPPTPAENEG